MTRTSTSFALVIGAALMALFGASAPAHSQELTMWSHWAAEDIKRSFVEDAIKRFEAAQPGAKVKPTFYEKTALYAALKTALRAGQAPDIIYAEPDQTEYIDNGFLLDISKGMNWNNIEPWARAVWSRGDKSYGLPLEAWTVEVYYNTRMMSELGVTSPLTAQPDEEAFLEIVKRARAKGITPLTIGVGDRPFPGAHLTHETLLKKLGKADYGRLLDGKLSWSDPRVVEALRFVKRIVDAGALPATFTSLKLGEAHLYFHTNPGALMFLNGSWYTSRSFNTPDRGGQPTGFPLGIMKFPGVKDGACNHCKTMAVGGSYVVNARTKHPEVAMAFLNSIATPEMGNKWLETVLVQTGIKSDASKIGGPHAAYFKTLEAANDGADYFFGLPIQILQGKARETFTQVVNQAFPAGLLSVDDVVKQMDAAMKQ